MQFMIILLRCNCIVGWLIIQNIIMMVLHQYVSVSQMEGDKTIVSCNRPLNLRMFNYTKSLLIGIFLGGQVYLTHVDGGNQCRFLLQLCFWIWFSLPRWSGHSSYSQPIILSYFGAQVEVEGGIWLVYAESDEFFPLILYPVVDYNLWNFVGIEPWTFEQRLGEAVFIFARCPHQARNLKVRTDSSNLLLYHHLVLKVL